MGDFGLPFAMARTLGGGKSFSPRHLVAHVRMAWNVEIRYQSSQTQIRVQREEGLAHKRRRFEIGKHMSQEMARVRVARVFLVRTDAISGVGRVAGVVGIRLRGRSRRGPRTGGGVVIDDNLVDREDGEGARDAAGNGDALVGSGAVGQNGARDGDGDGPRAAGGGGRVW